MLCRPDSQLAAPSSAKPVPCWNGRRRSPAQNEADLQLLRGRNYSLRLHAALWIRPESLRPPRLHVKAQGRRPEDRAAVVSLVFTATLGVDFERLRHKAPHNEQADLFARVSLDNSRPRGRLPARPCVVRTARGVSMTPRQLAGRQRIRYADAKIPPLPSAEPLRTACCRTQQRPNPPTLTRQIQHADTAAAAVRPPQQFLPSFRGAASSVVPATAHGADPAGITGACCREGTEATT